MYIEDRLFSENTGHTMYSVVMGELEYSLFSEFQERLYGKYDEALAKKLGVSKEAVRAGRAGFEGTETVHDIVNARSGQSGLVSGGFGANTDLSDFGQKSRKLQRGVEVNGGKSYGYINRGVKHINDEQLEAYKKLKAAKGGDKRRAFEALQRNQEQLMNTAQNNTVTHALNDQASRRMSGNFGTPNKKHTANVVTSQKPPVQQIVEEVKPVTEQVPNVIKPGDSSIVESSVKNQKSPKAFKLGTKGKIGLAVAGTGLAAYGVYRYNKNKQKR